MRFPVLTAPPCCDSVNLGAPAQMVVAATLAWIQPVRWLVLHLQVCAAAGANTSHTITQVPAAVQWVQYCCYGEGTCRHQLLSSNGALSSQPLTLAQCSQELPIVARLLDVP